eukprot:scaffold22585_cov149-Cylindrotheca_fusiformis.AAC.7
MITLLETRPQKARLTLAVKINSGLFLLLLLIHTALQVSAFTSPPTTAASAAIKTSTTSAVARELCLFSSSSNDNSNNRNSEDDVDNGDGDNKQMELADWRKFRASLIAQETKTNEGDSSSAPPSVAKENEKLLQEQNEALAKEYKREVWAHLIPDPEVGGLICRMPIEGELYWGTGFWKDKLDALLRMDTLGPPESLMAHWFPMAERMLARELKAITAAAAAKAQSGDEGMAILNPNDLEPDARILLEKYMDYKQTWQEVCLMIGSTQAVVINRPIGQTINKQLATLLLQNDNDKYPFGFIDKFVQAFSKEGVVYMGGPDLQAEPALVIHGIEGLEGSAELAPGTGIYMGGLEAAVEGVLDGTYKPLDFRFFLGRKVFDGSRQEIKHKIEQGAYRAVACNRSLALKQCLALPKPLWHEVLELCGGDMKSVSEIELAKRTDLKRRE